MNWNYIWLIAGRTDCPCMIGSHFESCCLLNGHGTRRSENDNTPQPRDQWTNCPFIGQQVGNCKSFTLTNYLADLFEMHHDPRSIPLCIQHYIQLTSLSIQVSRPSHSWDTAISIFYLANSRSRSWVRSKYEVAMWVQNPINSHPFVPCQSAIPFLRNDFFKIWPWKSKVKVMGEVNVESQYGSNILSTHIPFVPLQSAIPFLWYDFFKIWPRKSKVKVMGEVNVESHNKGPTFYRLTSLSFHVNRPSHSCDTAFFKIWPWKSKVKVMGEVKVESHKVGVTFYRLTSLSFYVNRP